MQLILVAEAMQPLPEALAADTPLEEAIALLADAAGDGLAVTDMDGRYRGVIGSEQIERAMRENEPGVTAGDLAQDIPPLTANQPLEEALGALVRAGSGLPVSTTANDTLVGWLTHTDVLHAYTQRLEGAGRPRRRPTETPASEARTGAAHADEYRIVDLEVTTAQPPAGKRLAELDWPANTTVLSVRRADQILGEDPGLRLELGDRLTLRVVKETPDELIATTISPPPSPDRPSKDDRNDAN
jgi:CBS domain-containing protein